MNRSKYNFDNNNINYITDNNNNNNDLLLVILIIISMIGLITLAVIL